MCLFVSGALQIAIALQSSAFVIWCRLESIQKQSSGGVRRLEAHHEMKIPERAVPYIVLSVYLR